MNPALPAPRPLPWVTLALAVLAAGLAMAPGAFASLIYDRAAIGDGELWRWFTGHLVHFGPAHLGFDMLSLLLAGAVLERTSRAGLCITLVAAAGLIPLAFEFLPPVGGRYAGLSGVVMALVGWLVTDLIQQPGWRRVAGFVAATLIVARWGWQLTAPGPTHTWIGIAGVESSVAAHTMGFAIGLGTSLLANRWCPGVRRRSSAKTALSKGFGASPSHRSYAHPR